MRREAVADDLAAAIGNTGTAHAGLLLADLLDRAEPGQTIALVVARRRRHGAAAAHHRRRSPRTAAPGNPVAAQIAAGDDGLAVRRPS